MDDVTGLIRAAGNGNAEVLKTLFTHVYVELKQLARKQLAGTASTLNTTGLVHEVYLKLVRPQGVDLHGRTHFFALAAKAMRQIVIDHARAHLTEKRGGDYAQMVSLEEAADIPGAELNPDELLRLDRALSQIECDQPRLAELVELRYFAGLAVAEIAALREVSERTLNRDWRRAKAYLHASLYPETEAG